MIDLEKKQPEMVKVFAPEQVVESTEMFFVQGDKSIDEGFCDAIKLRFKGGVDCAELISANMSLPAGSVLGSDTQDGSYVTFVNGIDNVNFELTQVNRHYVKIEVQHYTYMYKCEEVSVNNPRLSPRPDFRRKK